MFILLPFYNRRTTTERIIRCLKKQVRKDFKLILIDDGSTDGSGEMAQKYFPDSILLRGNGDWWWAGSLQQGYNWLLDHHVPDHDFVLITNDDVEFSPSFLQVGSKLLEKNPDTLILAKSYSRKGQELQDAGVHVEWKTLTFEPAKRPEEINILSTRGLFLRMGNFRKIGGFFPRLIPHYQSDYEFTHRAFRRGLKLKTFDELYVLEDMTQTGMRESAVGSFSDYVRKFFNKRSIFYFRSWFFFVLLASPWRWKVQNLVRVLTRLIPTSITNRYAIVTKPFRLLLNAVRYLAYPKPQISRSGSETKLDRPLVSADKIQVSRFQAKFVWNRFYFLFACSSPSPLPDFHLILRINAETTQELRIIPRRSVITNARSESNRFLWKCAFSVILPGRIPPKGTLYVFAVNRAPMTKLDF